MRENCLFNKSKRCTDCGDCNRCDIYSNKKCNNCGKCLELEGYDIRAIKIEEVFERNEDISEFEQLDELHEEYNKSVTEEDISWDYIDDIKDLKDIIGEDNQNNLSEEFPGLILYKKEVR